MADSHSDLFKVQSHNAYVTWARFDKTNVPEDAVVLGIDPTDRAKVLIGRVERNGHIIPGTIRGGVCRFRFENEWQTETDRIEILKDNFGVADKALVWRGAKGKQDDLTKLPLWAEVGGVQPLEAGQNENGEPTGLYLLSRPKGTLDIIPVAISSEDRHFNDGYIAYKGPETDFEVLDCEYMSYVAICPPCPLRPWDVRPEASTGE